jgi:hypothetical protein
MSLFPNAPLYLGSFRSPRPLSHGVTGAVTIELVDPAFAEPPSLRSYGVHGLRRATESLVEDVKRLKLVRCPRSLAATHHGFAFYVAAPVRSIRPRPEEAGQTAVSGPP